MFRKGIVLVVILLLVGVSIPSTGRVMEQSSNVSSNGIILYVGGSGPGNYTKIQDAIDDASDGDTVFVYNGTYVENVVVDKSLNLIGEDRNTTVIDGNEIGGDVVYVSADWVNLSGFSLRTSEDYGECLKVKSNHTNILDNNILLNILSWTIYIEGSDNSVIGNNFSYNGNEPRGTIWFGSNNSNFSNNIVSNMKYFYTDTSGMQPNTNYLYGNRFSNCYKGIFCMTGLDNSVICRNVFSNIEDESIYIRGGLVGCKIINNKFLNNKDTCMYLAAGDNSIVSHNVFQNNTHCINLGACENTNISGNTFIENNNCIELNWVSNFNKIYHNNFINNSINAYFWFLSFYNKWEGNYWDKPRVLPYPIIGRLGILIPWFNFDWRPAQEPYDIGV